MKPPVILRKTFIFLFAVSYKIIIKPILFHIDPELVHNHMTRFGERLARNPLYKSAISYTYQYENKALTQNIASVTFPNPVGLAAGFDYEGKLTQITPAIGFGFQTIGTVTYQQYEGNKKPRLGRLPKSRSLMVNKGFKNPGVFRFIKKLNEQKFDIPIGMSIGRTNSATLTQRDSIEDIISSFIALEYSKIHHSYYELNISCPNLHGNVTFYTKKTLNELLHEVDGLHLKRPVFIKMPIEKTNDEVMMLLETIANHSPAGVIFGNLQKNRHHPSLHQDEVRNFTTGYFSGKPTFERSNELIELSYKHFRGRLITIGCGGVFSAEDAYKKIKRGASLVQLITGMIYEGPQLISHINIRLVELLKREGFTHISQAVGSKYML